jgi:hypothetical protein
MTVHVIMFSAGGGSWAAAHRVVERHSREELRLVFTDTLYEDADAYRFLIEGASDVFGLRLKWNVPRAKEFPDYRDFATPIDGYCGNPEWRAFLAKLRRDATVALPGLVWLVEGRDPWEVYRDERILGNSRIDPCSKILKRQVADRWLKANCDPTDTIVYVGIDWTEKHRFDDGEGGGLRPRRAADGWRYEAPLCDAPWLWKPDITSMMRERDLLPPRLYAKGYTHNNCGGFCCKAGHAHYANRLRVDPNHFAYDEAMEAKMIAFLGHPYSMLTTRAGGEGKRTMTLASLRERLTRDGHDRPELDLDDYGGCGCFSDESACEIKSVA